jgi:hypothetical protein
MCNNTQARTGDVNSGSINSNASSSSSAAVHVQYEMKLIAPQVKLCSADAALIVAMGSASCKAITHATLIQVLASIYTMNSSLLNAVFESTLCYIHANMC